MSSLNIEIFGCLGVSIGARVLELLGKLGLFGFELEYVCLGFCDPAFDLLARLADRFTLSAAIRRRSLALKLCAYLGRWAHRLDEHFSAQRSGHTARTRHPTYASSNCSYLHNA